MKKEDILKDNFTNMALEYQVSHHKICRKIDTIFIDEIKHFKLLLNNFNNDYNCLGDSQINSICDKLKEVFNTSKIILMQDYISRFDKNVEELTATMYDFFIRKLNNKNTKSPSKELNKCLMEMCKFDVFLFEDKLENSLIDFSEEFIYRYVNSEDASRDYMHIIKNVNHNLVCNLKRAIADSVEDKQDIASRYNSLNKEVLNSNNYKR